MVLSWAVAGSFGDALALMIQQVGNSVPNRPSGMLDEVWAGTGAAPIAQRVRMASEKGGGLGGLQQGFQRALGLRLGAWGSGHWAAFLWVDDPKN